MANIYIGGNSGGSSTYTIQTLTASGSATGWSYMILVDCTSGNIQVTLPTSNLASNKGQSINIKRIDSTNNTCSIIPSVNTESIDGVVNNIVYLYNKNDSITISSLGNGDAKITADNRNSSGSIHSFIRVSRTAGQTSSSGGVSSGNPLSFTSIDLLQGNNIAYDVSTFTFTLKPNVTYKLTSGFQKVNLTDGGYFYFRWYNTTTPGYIGSGAGGDSVTSTSNTMFGSIAEATITPTVTTTVKCIITGCSSTVTSIGESAYPIWAEIEEVSRSATVLNTVDYVYGNIASTTVSTTGVVASLSSNCGNLSVSNNIINILAGKTYQINVSCRVTNANNVAVNPCVYNLTNSTTLVSGSLVSPNWSVNNDMPNGSMICTITPTVNTQLQIKADNVGGGSPAIVGNFTIQQIGSTATTSVPANVVPALKYPPVGVEIDTGMTWIDGRKIYRQSFSGTVSGSTTPLQASFSGVATVNQYGYAQRSDGGYESIGDCNSAVLITGGSLAFYNTGILNGKPYVIVVDYVKAS